MHTVKRFMVLLCLYGWAASNFSIQAASPPLRVAVASNFKHTFDAFLTKCQTTHPSLCQGIDTISASTGKILMQVASGAL